MKLLERAGADINDAMSRMDRLELVQTVRDQAEQINSHELQVLTKNQEIRAIGQQKQQLEREIHEKTEKIRQVEQEVREKTEESQETIRKLKKELSVSYYR